VVFIEVQRHLRVTLEAAEPHTRVPTPPAEHEELSAVNEQEELSAVN
jgi:hypothetical protein